jgi:RNA polymerase sigma-70 factor (ECF subfamily)
VAAVRRRAANAATRRTRATIEASHLVYQLKGYALENLQELVSASVAGDRSAFADLLEREAAAAFRAALAILRSPEEARDVVQDAAVRAWQQLPRLRSADAWPAWFRRITVRLALDERRHARHAREIQLSDEMGLAADPASRSDDAVSLLAAFGRLSPADRALLALRFELNLTVPEAAAALGIPVGTAKARLHRAIARLRKELSDDPA